MNTVSKKQDDSKQTEQKAEQKYSSSPMTIYHANIPIDRNQALREAGDWNDQDDY